MDPHPITTLGDMGGDPPPPDSLVHCNLLDFLAATPGGWADLVVTSPPYWMKVDYDGHGARQADIDGGQLGLEDTPEQYADRMADVLLKVAAKVRPEGSMVVNIGDTYMARRRRQATQTRHQAKHIGRAGAIAGHPEIPRKSLCMVPWMVADRVVRRGGYACRSADVWYDHSRMPEPRVKDRHWQKTELVFQFAMGEHSYSRLGEGEHPGPNVLNIPHAVGKGRHHATMPPALAAEYIDFLCPPGGLVFDPFGGEGTTAVVARSMGRSFVLTEIVREFCESAAGRIAAEACPEARPADRPEVLDAVVDAVGSSFATVSARGRRLVVPLEGLRLVGAVAVGDRLTVVVETRRTYLGQGPSGPRHAFSQTVHCLPA
jgi:DNA modification methylase